jgi:hypothetical protein
MTPDEPVSANWRKPGAALGTNPTNLQLIMA